MEEIYRKITIKSEADLPEKELLYIVHCKYENIDEWKMDEMVFYPKDKDVISNWLSRIDYYLLPVPPSAIPTDDQKQVFCDKLSDILMGVRLKNYITVDDDQMPLVDYLCQSLSTDISSGQEEIENIVEQVYFEIDDLFQSIHPQSSEREKKQDELIRQLNDDYKRRIKTAFSEIKKGGNDITLTRLGTKHSCYLTFVAEIDKIIVELASLKERER
jgi:hypothetical protein